MQLLKLLVQSDQSKSSDLTSQAVVFLFDPLQLLQFTLIQLSQESAPW